MYPWQTWRMPTTGYKRVVYYLTESWEEGIVAFADSLSISISGTYN
jgi:hypothetical protein